jgi:charged multivesicular body protein 6
LFHALFITLIDLEKRRNENNASPVTVNAQNVRIVTSFVAYRYHTVDTMGGISSKPVAKKVAPKGQVSDIDRAVLDLKNARDKLQKYKTQLEIDERKLLVKAKQAKEAGQNTTALNLLKLKRIKNRDYESVNTQLLNVLTLVETISSKQNEKEVLSAMRSGKDALQKLHEGTTLDDVLELMDQITEQNELEQEIAQAFSGVPALSASDEETVEAEMAALEAELTGGDHVTLPDVPTTIPLPDVPTNKLPEQEPVVAKPARTAVAT